MKKHSGLLSLAWVVWRLDVNEHLLRPCSGTACRMCLQCNQVLIFLKVQKALSMHHAACVLLSLWVKNTWMFCTPDEHSCLKAVAKCECMLCFKALTQLLFYFHTLFHVWLVKSSVTFFTRCPRFVFLLNWLCIHVFSYSKIFHMQLC